MCLCALSLIINLLCLHESFYKFIMFTVLKQLIIRCVDIDLTFMLSKYKDIGEFN